MDFISNKPYFPLGVLVPIISLLSILKPKEVLDVNIHDTYFVIKNLDLGIILSVFYGFLTISYLGIIKSNFVLVRWMTILHVVISLVGLILIFILFQLIREIKPEDFWNSIEDNKFNERVNGAIIILIFSIIGAQILFFTNVIYTLIKSFYRQNH